MFDYRSSVQPVVKSFKDLMIDEEASVKSKKPSAPKPPAASVVPKSQARPGGIKSPSVPGHADGVTVR